MLFPCSGASNVGLIADRAVRALAAKGAGKMFCLAGIGAHVSGMIESAKAVGRIVAVDGCPVGCAGKTLEMGGLVVTDQIVLSDLGIEKSHDAAVTRAQVDRAAEGIRKALKGGKVRKGGKR
jgi:uncharacterized metal-binding protein